MLFLLYVNDLPTSLTTPHVSLFADDVAIWAQDADLHKAERQIQQNIDELNSWSRVWKMDISVQKSECSFFSTNSHEAKWRPNLHLDGQPLRYSATPKFLGITYDRQLTFATHAAIVGRKLKRQAGALRCLASTDWGYDKHTLRCTYIATGRSTVEYAAAAWLPWIAPTTMEILESSQRYAARAITGHVKTTPSEAVLAEADLPTIETRSKQLSVIALEKSLRMAEKNPRCLIARKDVKQRTTKMSWRKKASEAWSVIFGNNAPAKAPALLPPWLQTGKHTFELEGKKSGEATADNQWAMRILHKGWREYDTTIYTDGSVQGMIGGGGIIVTTGPPEEPKVLSTHAIPTGQWCSSYQAELKAVKTALETIQKDSSIHKARIVSDSLSVLQRLQQASPPDPPRDQDERDILEYLSSLNERGCRLTFTWCPSHSGVPGNELADAHAKQGGQLPQTNVACHFESVKSVIRRNLRGKGISHERTRRIYGEYGEQINRPAERELSRKEQTTLS